MTADNNPEELDFGRLFGVLVESWRFLVIFVSTCSVVAAAVLFSLPNIYRAEALLVPNDNRNAGGMGALTAQYGGLASLAGIDLGGGVSETAALSLEVLKSRQFIGDFIERHNLLVPLMAPKKWESDKDILVIDSSQYDSEEARWVRKVSSSGSPTPTRQEAYEEFREILKIEQDKLSGLIRLSIDHISPSVSRQWVDLLVEDINQSMMRQDVEEAENAIRYLREQVESTSLSELRGVFFRLIEEQTKTVMLARVSNEYILKTVDPAVVPHEKVRPARAKILALVLVFSSLLGSLFLIARAAIRRR